MTDNLHKSSNPSPVYMSKHIGGLSNSSNKNDSDDLALDNNMDNNMDNNIDYTKTQSELINTSKSLLYNKKQHDTSYDISEFGYDRIANVNPFGQHMASQHGDRGYDYRDFPDEINKKQSGYDPYIGYLHRNGLIGKKKSRYNVNYLNINSSDRDKRSVIKTSKNDLLDVDPFLISGNLLRIYMNDTSNFNLNDKITISGITERELTIRSSVVDDNGAIVKYFNFTNGLQYMTAFADTNMMINSNLTTDTKEVYSDAKIEFRGFIGDKITQWYFDTRIFKVSIHEMVSGKRIKIEEDMYTVIKNTYLLPSLLLIGEYKIDMYGMVTEIISGSPYDANNGGGDYNSNLDDINWTTPSTNPPIQSVQRLSLPSFVFVNRVRAALVDANLNILPTLPTTIYKIMDYYERVQNVIRPILFSIAGIPNSNFDLRYRSNNREYQTVIRLLVPEATIISTATTVGNISLNMLNSTHRMYLTAADVERDLKIYASDSTATDVPVQNMFYIKLAYPYIKRPVEIGDPMMSGALMVRTYEDSKSDVTIRYKHYGGVPTNTITAELPVGFKSVVGYKYINDIVENTYIVVDLDRIGFFDKRFGGSNIYIGEIYDILSGYPNPNNYVIELDRVYTNIVMVRMVASSFPRSQKVIMDGVSGGRKNNRFYWQNADDGPIIYHIEIDSGNYSTDKLKTLFELAVSKIPRVGTNIRTNNFNHILLDIDSDSDKVTFKSYDVYEPGTTTLVKKISLNEINQLGSSNTDTQDIFYLYPSGGYYQTEYYQTVYYQNILSTLGRRIRIKISHPNNTVRIGQQILITQSTNYGNISQSYINSFHTVTRADSDSYDILVFNVNLDESLNLLLAGGNAIRIYTPSLFRIRYDYQDTFGKELGFRNVGDETSITQYDYVITNDVLYDGENLTSVVRELTNTPTATDYSVNNMIDGNIPLRNTLLLSGTPYIFITCNELQNCKSIGLVKDYFYRIDLNKQIAQNELDKYIYNSFVDTPMILNDPIKRLTKLTIGIVSSDNSYYDFNGLDHSFNLEIVTFDETPEATSLIQ